MEAQINQPFPAHCRTDVVSSGHCRSTVFFYIAAVAIGAKLISGPLAYIAVEHDAWLSVYIGLACLFFSVLIALAFPETRDLSAAGSQESHGTDSAGSNGESRDSSPSDSFSKNRAVWTRISDALELKQMAVLVRYFFWENKRLGLLLVSFAFTTLGNYASVLLMQYTTKRFGWTWAKVR